MKKIDFYYFTGTGNTHLVIKRMKEVFEDNGVKVTLYKMEKTNPENVEISDVLGIGFPVAFQGTYPFVWKFVEGLPNSKGTPVFMVDTLQGFSGGVVGPMGKILRRKGYDTIGAKKIRMPSNLLRRKIDKEKDRNKIEKGIRVAEKYAKDLLKGNTHWGYVPLISDFISLFSRKEGLWRLSRHFFKMEVSRKKCTKCGICKEICPVDNIVMPDYPIHGESCYFCMRCFSFCPEEAIHIGKTDAKPYHSIGLKELLKD